METKKKIVDSARELFMRYGIRSVTMDDVSRDAAMSKKTLYQYFENKDSLVLSVAEDHFETETAEFREIQQVAEDAVHELILVSQCLRKHVFKMNPALLLDMQKFHGASWEKYLAFKHGVIRSQIKSNLERGVEEGFFRKEIDAEVLSILRVEQVQLAFDPRIFPTNSFDFKEIQLQVMDHFINGLLTDHGRQKYEDYSTQQTNMLSK